MKPILFIVALAMLISLMGLTWSELIPRPMHPLNPVWTRSFELYGQPHAVWLDQYDRVGANTGILTRALKAAARKKQTPELVVYAIPLRDLGQSSEGGFRSYEDYLADNRLNADLIRQFVEASSITPVLYLEPDSLPLAVQYRRDHHGNAESQAIYADRLKTIRALIAMYHQAGAKVYLDAGHSGWFDYGDADVQRIADALNAAGIAHADGLATNVSNRQPILEESETDQVRDTAGHPARTEAHYLSRLLTMLENAHLDVRVDTSRNGAPLSHFKARQYYLAPEQRQGGHQSGRLIDNESATGRLVGVWETDASGEVWCFPYYGEPKRLARLTGKEKYTYDAARRILSAPPWLDAVGDVRPGPAPTDTPSPDVAPLIHSYRYIKPPDDCDGSLNCPPGASKHDINVATAHRQPEGPLVSADIWLH